MQRSDDEFQHHEHQLFIGTFTLTRLQTGASQPLEETILDKTDDTTCARVQGTSLTIIVIIIRPKAPWSLPQRAHNREVTRVWVQPVAVRDVTPSRA